LKDPLAGPRGGTTMNRATPLASFAAAMDDPTSVREPVRLIPAAPSGAEDGFRQLVSGVSDYAIFLLDASGRVTTWNDGAQHLKQYKPAEIIGRHFSVFYPEEARLRKFPEKELEVASHLGRFEDEGWRLRKDGTKFWANVVITALRSDSGELRGFLKITRDLTDRRHAEETLRQSEEKFRLLVEGVRDYALFMLDPAGIIVSWNLGAERIKGYRAAEIIGRHFSIFYPPEDIVSRKPERELEEAIERGSVEDEGWRIRKNGEPFWANVVITALHGPDGSLRGFAKVTRDMTERRHVLELMEADRQKNEFLALLAHELRNPLAPIRTALHILGQPNAGSTEAARAHAIASRQVVHMARLLDDLLDVGRISEGKMELRPESFDLRELVRRSVDAIGAVAAERRQTVVVDVPPEEVSIVADPTRIEQVVTNLLSNSIKYTDPGGRIRVRAAREGDEAIVEVTDNGIGIAPSMLPKIFDLFVQAERRVDRSVGGVGIGLTLVRKIVELHGGRVVASSPGPGQGSRFLVSLPLRWAPAIAPAPTPPLVAEHRRPLRVLVVDDNIDAADGLSMMIRLLGHDARAVFDGTSAIQIAPAFRPDVVLLDIGMPGLDGHAVARRLRENEATRGAYLVALSGWGQTEDRNRSREAGFDEHLVKPADPRQLERLLVDRSS
jgi:PAS domain S-box-containing protein